MTVSKELLDILVCPETKQKVQPIDPELLDRINDCIKQGKALRRDGEAEESPIDGGLIREDKQYVYPIRDDIPVMLIDEAIDMSQIPEQES